MLTHTCLLSLCLCGIDVDSLTSQDVREAIASLKEAILNAHHPQRHWDPPHMPAGESARQLEGGYTALAALALITAGDDAQAEPVHSALHDLQHMEPEGTYAIAFRAQLWAMLPDSYRPALKSDVRRLVDAFHMEQGGWDYLCRPVKRIPRVSPSTRHVAILALHAASTRGIQAPRLLLQRVEQATFESQDDEGGWSYHEGSPATGSMTAAGIFTLLMIQDLLDDRRSAQERRAKHIKKGMQWLDDRFVASPCPGGGRCAKFPMYYLYSLERVALATGTRRLAGRDWMRQAAATVLEKLCKRGPDGKWEAKGRTSQALLRQQCFALMVLHRAIQPLSAAILDLDAGDHAAPLANDLCDHLLVHHETESHWQRVFPDDLIDVWLESPMLIVSGKGTPSRLHDIRRDLHRWQHADGPAPDIPLANMFSQYLDRGGLLIIDSANRHFANAMQALCDLGIEEGQWDRVHSTHSIYHLLEPVPRKRRVDVLRRGSRILAVMTTKPSPELLANVWALATERSTFPPRLDLQESSTTPVATGPTARVHVLSHSSEPGAIEALHRWCAQTGRSLHRDPDAKLVLAQGPQHATEAIALAQAGHVVLLSDGNPDIISKHVNLKPISAPTWLTGIGIHQGCDVSQPLWRPTTRQQGRALPHTDLLAGSMPNGGMLIVARSDLFHALLARPHWGLHGWDSKSARGLIWNLAQWSTAMLTETAYPEGDDEKLQQAAGQRMDTRKRIDHWRIAGRCHHSITDGGVAPGRHPPPEC